MKIELHNKTLLQLSLIQGVGPVTIAALMRAFKKEEFNDALVYASASLLQERAGISARLAQAIVAGMRDTKLIECELELIEKLSVSIVTIFDELYPPLLAHVYAPPPVLWYKGDLAATRMPSVAIVGSRAANWYAKAVIAKFVPPLIDAGFAIVSGGARGVDAWAHQETMRVSGKTVAVLGSGFGHLYPLEHAGLFDQIESQSGVVVSVFSCATRPMPGNFPARNTVIAGIANACLVVQAAEKSGALITARHALEFGRDLFVVPGAITDPLMDGCHKLIGQGAYVAYDIKVLLEQLGVPVSKNSHPVLSVAPSDALTDQHKALLALCLQPATLEYLQAKTLLPEATIRELLFELHIEGKVAQNHMGFWQVQ